MFFAKAIWVWAWTMVGVFAAFLFLLTGHPALTILSVPVAAVIALAPYWNRRTKSFTKPPTSPKKLIGYGLTVAVALWGMIYMPMQSIATVKQYSSNPMAAIDYSPLIGLVLIVVITTISHFVYRKESGMTRRMFFLAVWIVSIIWSPLNSARAANQLLAAQKVWQGQCTIQTIRTGESGIHFNIKCGEQGVALAYGSRIAEEMLLGKNLNCTLNAAGGATCRLP